MPLILVIATGNLCRDSVSTNDSRRQDTVPNSILLDLTFNLLLLFAFCLLRCVFHRKKPVCAERISSKVNLCEPFTCLLLLLLFLCLPRSLFLVSTFCSTQNLVAVARFWLLAHIQSGFEWSEKEVCNNVFEFLLSLHLLLFVLFCLRRLGQQRCSFWAPVCSALMLRNYY